MSKYPKRSRRLRFREVFFANNGSGPYTCYKRNEFVEFDEVSIHHIDQDHSNSELSNLAATHFGCHRSLHAAELFEVSALKAQPQNQVVPVWSDKLHRAFRLISTAGASALVQKMSESAKKRWANETIEQ